MGFAPFNEPFWGFLMASFFIQGLEAVSCPKDWFLYEQHCYGFFQNKLTWNDAETECTTFGKYAHLASILSERELNTISSSLLTSYAKSFRIWIGLYKMTGGMTRMRWLDAAVVDYMPQAPAQFSDPTGKRNCFELYGKSVRSKAHKTCIETLKEAESS